MITQNRTTPNALQLDNSLAVGVHSSGNDALALQPDPLGITDGQGQRVVVDTKTDPLNAMSETVQYFHGSPTDVNKDRMNAKMKNAFSLSYRHSGDVEVKRADNLKAL